VVQPNGLRNLGSSCYAHPPILSVLSRLPTGTFEGFPALHRFHSELVGPTLPPGTLDPKLVMTTINWAPAQYYNDPVEFLQRFLHWMLDNDLKQAASTFVHALKFSKQCTCGKRSDLPFDPSPLDRPHASRLDSDQQFVWPVDIVNDGVRKKGISIATRTPIETLEAHLHAVTRTTLRYRCDEAACTQERLLPHVHRDGQLHTVDTTVTFAADSPQPNQLVIQLKRFRYRSAAVAVAHIQKEIDVPIFFNPNLVEKGRMSELPMDEVYYEVLCIYLRFKLESWICPRVLYMSDVCGYRCVCVFLCFYFSSCFFLVSNLLLMLLPCSDSLCGVLAGGFLHAYARPPLHVSISRWSLVEYQRSGGQASQHCRRSKRLFLLFHKQARFPIGGFIGRGAVRNQSHFLAL
jgi:hypothetical protein